MSNDPSAVKELIQDNSKFVIVSHQSPDGDAIGSSMGLHQILSNLNKTVSIILPDRPSSVLEPFLKAVSSIFTMKIHRIVKHSSKMPRCYLHWTLIQAVE